MTRLTEGICYVPDGGNCKRGEAWQWRITALIPFCLCPKCLESVNVKWIMSEFFLPLFLEASNLFQLPPRNRFQVLERAGRWRGGERWADTSLCGWRDLTKKYRFLAQRNIQFLLNTIPIKRKYIYYSAETPRGSDVRVNLFQRRLVHSDYMYVLFVCPLGLYTRSAGHTVIMTLIYIISTLTSSGESKLKENVVFVPTIIRLCD